MEYIYTDKYIEHDIYKLEQAIENIADEVKDLYDIEDDYYYGERYPDEVDKIKTTISVDSREGSLKAEKYRDYLEEIRQEFDYCARYYLDNLNKEMQEEDEND